ncbi:uncharacterized protein H6S33_010484 [Morchella sextelata]|uniref:uncharacterized protein n=1 Tax=Morchella sextelata TaxID=1174677 RepID=UPI001D043064|nr:uncharacterized protein H6S33_010484 [Morchella sextelata]KAH0612432.1 hypothetical protein H6S33_010484 [Morchella sextelata]
MEYNMASLLAILHIPLSPTPRTSFSARTRCLRNTRCAGNMACHNNPYQFVTGFVGPVPRQRCHFHSVGINQKISGSTFFWDII